MKRNEAVDIDAPRSVLLLLRGKLTEFDDAIPRRADVATMRVQREVITANVHSVSAKILLDVNNRSILVKNPRGIFQREKVGFLVIHQHPRSQFCSGCQMKLRQKPIADQELRLTRIVSTLLIDKLGTMLLTKGFEGCGWLRTLIQMPEILKHRLCAPERAEDANGHSCGKQSY